MDRELKSRLFRGGSSIINIIYIKNSQSCLEKKIMLQTKLCIFKIITFQATSSYSFIVFELFYNTVDCS